MTVLDCLPKALTLSTVGNDGRIITKEVCRCLLTAIAKIGLSYETGGGGGGTIKCQMPGPAGDSS